MVDEADEDARTGATITLTDVARAAGVGESTASRVLRGHGSFSAKTRESVLAAARSLGYVPNRIAGTLASTGSKLVGIVIPSLSNIVFPDVLRGANTVLVGAGYQPVVAVTDYDQGREESVVESLLSWRPAGMMVAGLEHTEPTTVRLRNARVRVAELLDTDGEGIDIVVGYSNREVGRTSARHLVTRGYRRIGYVGHDLSRDLRAAKRFAAFRTALGEAGLECRRRRNRPCLVLDTSRARWAGPLAGTQPRSRCRLLLQRRHGDRRIFSLPGARHRHPQAAWRSSATTASMWHGAPRSRLRPS